MDAYFHTDYVWQKTKFLFTVDKFGIKIGFYLRLGREEYGGGGAESCREGAAQA